MSVTFETLMPDVARRLLGDPVRHLSSAKDWRYGSKGSLSVDPNRGVWRDHETGEGGGVIDLIKRTLRCDGRTAGEWLEQLPGGDMLERGGYEPHAKAPATDPAARIEGALRLWQAARHPVGTPVESYLASRAVSLTSEISGEVLRFHPRCPFGKDEASATVYLPCMVALMRDMRTDEPVAIHRTPLVPNRKELGRKMLGRVEGAAIMLSPSEGVTCTLGIAEGIETALSVMAEGWGPMWAMGSAGGIERLPVLPGIRTLTVFADNDASGTGYRAARAVGQRYADAGAEVSVFVPPSVGEDFNDLAQRRAGGVGD